MTPKEYVKLVVDNIIHETDQQTIMYIITKVNYIMTNFIKTEDKADLSAELWNTLKKMFIKIESASLFNLVFDSALGFAIGSSDETH